MIILDFILACLIVIRLNAAALAETQAEFEHLELTPAPKSTVKKSHNMGTVLLKLHGMH